jgi:16S rRNA (cytidine1402-2'-O)-methyltransferase
MVEGAQADDTGRLDEESERVLALLLEELPLKRAVALGTRITGAARNLLYARALAMKPEETSDQDGKTE